MAYKSVSTSTNENLAKYELFSYKEKLYNSDPLGGNLKKKSDIYSMIAYIDNTSVKISAGHWYRFGVKRQNLEAKSYQKFDIDVK